LLFRLAAAAAILGAFCTHTQPPAQWFKAPERKIGVSQTTASTELALPPPNFTENSQSAYGELIGGCQDAPAEQRAELDVKQLLQA
jgi:hypothetical protein